MDTVIYLNGFQPEPWKAPGAQTGRRRGGKVFAQLIKDGRLGAYQEAIREELADFDLKMYDENTHFMLEMFFWRKLEEYTPTLGRKSKRKWADATNMGKAFEDALQGVVYKNDSMSVCPVPRIISQSEDTRPAVLAVIRPVPSIGAPRLGLSNWHHVLQFIDSVNDKDYEVIARQYE